MRKSILGLVVLLIGVRETDAEMWQYSNNLPANVSAGAAVTLDGYIYNIGGVNDDNGWEQVNWVNKYNPTSGQWTAVAPLPTATHYLGACAINGSIYTVGGLGNSETSRYDPATNAWTQLAPTPLSQDAAGVASFNGKIYTFGGNNGYESTYSAVMCYDPSINVWSQVGDMPDVGEPYAAVTLNGKIYLAAGAVAPTGNSTDHLWSYDPSTSGWDTSLPDMQTPRMFQALVVAAGRIYAIGGWDSDLGEWPDPAAHLSTVESWAPGETQWRSEPSTNVPRYLLTAAVVGDNIYAIGGTNRLLR